MSDPGPGGRRTVPRHRVLGPAVAVLVVLGACSPDSPTPVPERKVDPELTLGFTQLIPREGTPRGLLRVQNTGDAALMVSAVGIEWGGYPGGSPTPADPVVEAGRTLDIQLELPPPACDAVGDEPVVGVVETPSGTVRQPLEPTGTTYVRRLWRTQCEVALVASTAHLGYSLRWRVVGDGSDAMALGGLVLRRVAGDGPVVVESVDGSVLHGLRLLGRTVLPPGRQGARLPLAITPGNRCDEHARGQATAPFDFMARLRIGDRSGIAYRLEVPLAAMEAATDALDLACAARAGR